MLRASSDDGDARALEEPVPARVYRLYGECARLVIRTVRGERVYLMRRTAGRSTPSAGLTIS